MKNKSVCHASGSQKSTLLSNAKLSGALIYSIHPMFAFSNKNMSIEELEKIYFSIEGDLDEENINNLPVINLIKATGNKYFIRDIKDSASYHLANVFVSNLVLSLLHIGTSYLENLGLSEKQAIEALYPLIKGNIESIYNKGFKNSLTGPVARGDIKTIEKHIEVLSPEHKNLYNSLSINLLKLVADCNYEKQHIQSEEYISNCNSLKKENALKELLNTSTKYKEIFRLLGGTE